MRILRHLAFFALVAVVANAQTKNTITATIQDPQGQLAASGTVKFRITPFNPRILFRVAGTATIAPLETTCGINSSGQLKSVDLASACLVWGTDQITPANTSYEVLIFPNGDTGADIPCVLFPGSGASIDLSNATFCPAGSRVNPEWALFPTNPLTANILPGTDNFYVVGDATHRFASGAILNFLTQVVTVTNVPAPGNPGVGQSKYFVDTADGLFKCLNAAGGSCNSATITTPLISGNANPATAGEIRLAAGDTLRYRNQANNANLTCLSKNASDVLVIGCNGSFAVNTANAVTFAVSSPAAPRQYTIPDAGGNATIPFLEKAQSWTAAQTFAAGAVHSPGTTVTNTGATVTGGTYTSGTYTGAATGNKIILPGGVTSQQTAQVGTGAAAAITNFTYTIPANTVSATSYVEIYWSLSHSAGTASVSYTLDLGDSTGNVLAATNAAVVSGRIVITKGTTSNANVYVAVHTTEGNGSVPSINASLTTTTLVSQSCAITLKFNVAATDQIVGQQFIPHQLQ